jgi:TonB-linked SusC/RagA family outer membrane protein
MKNCLRIVCVVGILLLTAAFSGAVFAQGTLKGRITDKATGEGVVEATVVVEGTNYGVLTDLDGYYSLELADGEFMIQVTYVGYAAQTQSVTIKNGQTVTLDFALGVNDEVLSELVVVGYGSQYKRELVGSVAKVESKQLNEVVGASFEMALQGKAAGVQLTQSSGAAGAGSVVRIRGLASIGAGGDPLYVIDGIPITTDNFLLGTSGASNNNPLSSINPNDIESIEILKDASAAAIYGSRAANGVILVTTKRGKKSDGKPIFNFSARMGTSDPTVLPNLLSADEWLAVRQEAWENDGNAGRAPLPKTITDRGWNYDSIAGINTNWYDQVVQTGIKQDYNLSMRQGSDVFRTYVGVSYSDSESYLRGNKFQRISGRANFDYKPIKQLNIGLSTSASRGFNFRQNQSWSGGLGDAMTWLLPIYPVYDSNGNYFLGGSPGFKRDHSSSRVQEWRFVENLTASILPMEGLSINLSGNLDYMKLSNFYFSDSLFENGPSKAYAGYINIPNWSAFGTATYDVKLPNKNHALRALLGIERQSASQLSASEEYLGSNRHIYEGTEGGVESYKNDFVRDRFSSNNYNFLSYFSRINYNFKEKLFLQGVVRRDYSSKFGENYRWGWFPSIGVGYLLSEEPFIKDLGIINNLKIKASFGKTGNANIPWTEQYSDYQYGQEIGQGSYYNENPIRYIKKLDNPDLRWETNYTYDAGIEIGFLENVITSELTVYNRRAVDAILLGRLPASSGIGNSRDDLIRYENAAKINNFGVEFGLVSRNIIKDHFKWKTDFNISFNKNKVLDVSSATPDALGAAYTGDVRAIVGESISSNYLIPFSHVDAETGRPVYIDANGNETFVYDVVNNRQAVGNGMPRWFGGFTNTFDIKRFNVGIGFTFTQGNTLYDDAAKRFLGVVENWNLQNAILDRWRQAGDEASYPQLTYSMLNWGGNDNLWQNNHTLWLYDASMIRLRNLSLGYTFPFKDNAAINSIRLTASATNLFTWSETIQYGLDPEIARERDDATARNIGGTGISYLTSPQEKTFNIGIDVEF